MIHIQQKAEPVKKLVGYNSKTRTIITMPFRCVRKPPKKNPGCPYFCFISNPRLIVSKGINPFMWLHCYRDSSILPTEAPSYLFPESDLVDKAHCPVSYSKRTDFDYAYFTISGDRGTFYKGLDNFLVDVQVLNNMGLRGIVVFYNGTKHLDKGQMRMLRKANVTIKDGRMPRGEVVDLMSRTKFGLFPNKADCSPRMIPEYFIQNRPAVVNEDIQGGWHYFDNRSFGSLYKSQDADSLRSAVSYVTGLPRTQMLIWEENYGFARGSRRLAELLNKHFPCDEVKNSTHVYFKEYELIFTKMPELFE